MNYWALVIGSLSATFIKVVISYFLIKYKPKLNLNLHQLKII